MFLRYRDSLSKTTAYIAAPLHVPTEGDRRALIALGYSGKLVMLDAASRRARSILADIAKVAPCSTEEGRLRFGKLSLPDRARAPESREGGHPTAEGRPAA